MNENKESLNNENVSEENNAEKTPADKRVVVMKCKKCGGNMYLVDGSISCEDCGEKPSFSWF